MRLVPKLDPSDPVSVRTWLVRAHEQIRRLGERKDANIDDLRRIQTRVARVVKASMAAGTMHRFVDLRGQRAPLHRWRLIAEVLEGRHSTVPSLSGRWQRVRDAQTGRPIYVTDEHSLDWFIDHAAKCVQALAREVTTPPRPAAPPSHDVSVAWAEAAQVLKKEAGKGSIASARRWAKEASLVTGADQLRHSQLNALVKYVKARRRRSS